MSRSPSSSRAGRVVALAITAAMTVLGLATAGPAFAGTAGGDHGHHGREHFRPQVITLVIKAHGQQQRSVVFASGPVHGVGTDQQVSGNLDVFTFRAGSVNVYHAATFDSQPKIDRRHCTATFFELGTFKFKGGTGAYRDARSRDGRYKLTVYAQLGRVHHKHCKPSCDTNMNHDPVSSVSVVNAYGLAAV